MFTRRPGERTSPGFRAFWVRSTIGCGTTEPGLQIYDGARLDVPVPGLGGVRYGPNGGICLETQHFPDSPNRNHFPSITLRPDGVYRHITEYRFMPR